MAEMYPVVEVPAWVRDFKRQEFLGTKEKFWFEDTAGTEWLYKEGRLGTGEDWSEKVSAELCKILGIPHAEYDFAV